MVKFFGVVGFGHSEESSPDVWEDVITEYPYFGDVLRPGRDYPDQDSSVLPGIQLRNPISIVADAYALEHYFAIRYVKYENALWEVTNVALERPRLILRLGGVYNGPTPNGSQ